MSTENDKARELLKRFVEISHNLPNPNASLVRAAREYLAETEPKHPVEVEFDGWAHREVCFGHNVVLLRKAAMHFAKWGMNYAADMAVVDAAAHTETCVCWGCAIRDAAKEVPSE